MVLLLICVSGDSGLGFDLSSSGTRGSSEEY